MYITVFLQYLQRIKSVQMSSTFALSSLKTESENNAIRSKYQNIIWNSYHLFADFEPTLNSKLTLLPFLLSILEIK